MHFLSLPLRGNGDDVDDADDADIDGSLVVEARDSSLDFSLGADHFNAVQHSQQTFKKNPFFQIFSSDPIFLFLTII